MFIFDNAFMHKHKNNVLEQFKKNSDDMFMSLLTHTRVLLFSFYTYKKNHLADEEKEEFGIYEEVKETFESIEKSSFINTFTYLLANYTYTFDVNVVEEAYKLALDAYNKNAETPDEIDNADFFKHSQKRILEQYYQQQEQNSIRFFDLYEHLAKLYLLTKEERKLIKKDLKNNFENLVVWELSFVKNEYKKSKKGNENGIQKI